MQRKRRGIHADASLFLSLRTSATLRLPRKSKLLLLDGGFSPHKLRFSIRLDGDESPVSLRVRNIDFKEFFSTTQRC